MTEYEDVFSRKEIADMYATNEPLPLDDLYELEGTALTIKELNKKIDFFKDYKKKKVEKINEEIKVTENKIEFLKAVIVATLKKFNEKSTRFPGTCDIVSRTQKANWVINDEEEFLRIIENAMESGENVDGVVETVIQKNIVKKEANKLLDSWEKSGKLEELLSDIEEDSEAFVVKKPAYLSVSLKFEEDEDQKKSKDNQEEDVIPSKNSQYDSI